MLNECCHRPVTTPVQKYCGFLRLIAINTLEISTYLFILFILASLYRLRGDIIHISLLDNTGDILPSPSERWDDSFIFKGGAASELSKQASLISCSSICSEGTSMYTNADAYSSTDTGFKSCGGGGGSVRALKESVIRQNTVTTHTSSTSTSGHSSKHTNIVFSISYNTNCCIFYICFSDVFLISISVVG